MKKLLLILFAFTVSNLALGQSTTYWQQQVNNTIDVSLNDNQHTLDGYIKMEYFNNSPDSLFFIWIHLWPNAFKNDQTALTDQLLENGSTDFYFSDNEKRGYINRLDFKVDYALAKTEDHPQHQDIIKLLLPKPLAPHQHCKIETPFHVKLPFNFSRGGHQGQSYQITQWFPKPAVYDRHGWHPIPYLDQGEFYSEFGNYEVQIHLPANYIVAATGNLVKQEVELNTTKKTNTIPAEEIKEKKGFKKNAAEEKAAIPSSNKIKTLVYKQDHVHDFAWFADKSFIEKKDSLQLPSGKIITVAVYSYKEDQEIWKNSIRYTKQAILNKSLQLGEYPYDIVSVVNGGNGGGMEYPTITLLESGGNEKTLDFVINHEVGHNWFYGILASNERQFPWMDEGMNTYYDNRYSLQQYGNSFVDFVPVPGSFLKKRMPEDISQTLLQTILKIKKDQPINGPSDSFTNYNYNAIVYIKTGNWMKMLEDSLGKAVFDQCMKTYFQRWQFKHPYPEDFKNILDEVSGKNTASYFSLLNQRGPIPEKKAKKDIRLTSFFSLKNAHDHHYIAIAPMAGINFYDKVMLGLAIHNYSLPPTKFQFIAIPLFGTASKQFNGIGKLSYHWYPGNHGAQAIIAVSGSRFHYDSFTDSMGTKAYLSFSKISPSFKYIFGNTHPRTTITRYIQWKTFLLKEQGLQFQRDTIRQLDIITYPFASRYLNQLQFVIENNRKLYPWRAAFQGEQGDGFIRLNFTGNYYFNYVKGGGLAVRIFAGKFIYTADKTFARQFATDAFHLNMTGPKGNEDYTYSNYFFGRNEFDKAASQQIMIRDGAFKVRTDMLSDKVGKTDNWLAAVNLTTDIPANINPLQLLPFKIPLKAFLDLGTYAEAWKNNAPTGRFVYDAGLQLSLFKNTVNVYFPLLYSKLYKDYIKSTIPDKQFLRNIVFSIDLQNISLQKFIPQLPL